MDYLEIEIDGIINEYYIVAINIDLRSEPICFFTFAIKQNGNLTNKEYNFNIADERFRNFYYNWSSNEDIYKELLKDFPNGIYKKE